MTRNTSQIARAIGAVRSERFFRMGVKFAGEGIPLDDDIQPPCIEGLEPRAEPRQLTWGKLLDGFSDVFGGAHEGEHSIQA